MKLSSRFVGIIIKLAYIILIKVSYILNFTYIQYEKTHGKLARRLLVLWHYHYFFQISYVSQTKLIAALSGVE